MAKKGHHAFTIPKFETPTRFYRNARLREADLQTRLYALGNYSRGHRWGLWPSKVEDSR